MKNIHVVQARLIEEVAQNEPGIQQGEPILFSNEWLVNCGRLGKGIVIAETHDGNPQRRLYGTLIIQCELPLFFPTPQKKKKDFCSPIS